MADKHGPNRLNRYQEIHETVMGHLRDDGFVVEDDLAFADLGNGLIELRGTVKCLGGIRVEVEKLLEILDGDGAEAMVQTFAYSYHACLEGGQGNIVRYDSPHVDHNQDHHVHRYDPFSGDVTGRVTMHGESGWPTLGEMLYELRDWYYANFERLRDT